ncbi:Zinc metalloproteinase/disintegrin VMP-II [Sesbania bispinosa]|nr:Zinc metalloproteinase/disintegrin VMP-II [Sesbania bispinosa]
MTRLDWNPYKYAITIAHDSHKILFQAIDWHHNITSAIHCDPLKQKTKYSKREALHLWKSTAMGRSLLHTIAVAHLDNVKNNSSSD